MSGACSSRCLAGVSSIIAAATRYDTTDGSSGSSAVPDTDRSRAPASRRWYCRNARSTPSASAPAPSPGCSSSSSSSPVRNAPDASTDTSRTRVVPVASTSKVPSGRSRIVAASATQPTPWNALRGSAPKPAAGPRCGSALGSGMPGALGATSWPSRIATTAKRRGSSSGVFSSVRIIAR